ncbi:MAG: endonuclease [Bermanella sp.]
MKHLIFILLLVTVSSAFSAGGPSFSKSKKALAKTIYADHKISFYCGCDYSLKPKPKKPNKKQLTPDWQSCDYTPRKQAKRASRIEWEHVMPAHHFGQHMQCWRDSGRKACKKDPVFKAMEADMYNLVPAVGEVNGDRSNFKFGMIDGEKRAYGQCDVEIDFKARKVEPKPSIRGDIARIYFYMSEKYRVKLSKQQRQLMSTWDKKDPIDAWERERNLRIKKIQGNKNRYVF